MTRSLLTLASLALLGSGCAPVERPTNADPAAGAPAVTVLGAGQTCIDRERVRHTVVRSDRVIDFEMAGGKVYRNTLASNCPNLGFDRAITYETSISQLCRQQIVYTLQTIGGVPQRGTACSLGEFVPVEYAKAERDGT